MSYNDFIDSPTSPARSVKLVSPGVFPLTDCKAIRTLTAGDITFRCINDTADRTLTGVPADFLINAFVQYVTSSTATLIGYFATPVATAQVTLDSYLSFRSTVSADQRVDASGNRMVATSSLADTGLPAKTIAANRGIKFGTFFKVSDYQSDATFAALVRTYSNHYVISNSPATLQPTEGVWQWTNADAFAALATADGKSWRFHTLMYPAKDMPWATTSTVTSSNWMAKIDAHLNAIAARPWSQQMTTIDVVNEVCRGDNSGDAANIYGLRKLQNDSTVIPWYPAASANPYTVPGRSTMADPGATYVLYAFVKARQLWPTKPLYFCHDSLEQVNTTSSAAASYSRQQNANVLALLTALLAAGAPIDGVNFQGHFVFTRTMPGVEFRTFVRAVKALGLKFIVGEHDNRSGQTDGNNPANYTTDEYYRIQADISKHYLDVVVPEIDGGELLTWGVSDLYQAWEAGELPLPYDTSGNPKPMLTAIRNSLLKI